MCHVAEDQKIKLKTSTHATPPYREFSSSSRKKKMKKMEKDLGPWTINPHRGGD
jgi:hypothetical protein